MNSTTTLAPSRPSATDAATRLSALAISFSNSTRLGRLVSVSRSARWRRRSLALRSRAARPLLCARRRVSTLLTSSVASTGPAAQATSSSPQLWPDSPPSLRQNASAAKRAPVIPTTWIMQIRKPATVALATWKPLPRRAPRTRKNASSNVADAQIATTIVPMTICQFHSMAGAMSSAATPRKCIAAKPAPTASAAVHRRGQDSLSRLTANSATAEAATAASHDAAVRPTP